MAWSGRFDGWSGRFDGWSGHLMMRLSETAFFEKLSEFFYYPETVVIAFSGA
jgi:hypothetical protein